MQIGAPQCKLPFIYCVCSTLRPTPFIPDADQQPLATSDFSSGLAVRQMEAPTLAPTKWPLQTKPPAPQAFLLWPLQKAAARREDFEVYHSTSSCSRHGLHHIQQY